MPKLFVGGALALVIASRSCAPALPAALPAPPAFGTPVAVTIEGYHGEAMEPFVSTDGKYLFFNNRNDPPDNTNLYYARRVNDTTFEYAGPVTGANSAALDAVASIDAAGVFYFVSTRSYSRTLATIYRGTFANGHVSNVAIVSGVSKSKPGWVNFDAGVNASGSTLYFTRASPPAGSGSPAIYVATRTSPTSAFGPATKLTTLTGFVEAPALSPDGRSLYFHRLVGGKFAIYRASKR